MDTATLRILCDRVDKARSNLAIALENINRVKHHNGLHGYSVTVNGVMVDVSVFDSRTYNGTLIRGREMIHLGAIKALSAIFDQREEELKTAINMLEQQITKGE